MHELNLILNVHLKINSEKNNFLIFFVSFYVSRKIKMKFCPIKPGKQLIKINSCPVHFRIFYRVWIQKTHELTARDGLDSVHILPGEIKNSCNAFYNCNHQEIGLQKICVLQKK